MRAVETSELDRDPGPGTPAVPKRSRTSRLLPVGLAIASLFTGLALAAISVEASHRQEQQLLAERANELAATLTISTEQNRAVLSSANTVLRTENGRRLFAGIVGQLAAGGATVSAVDTSRGEHRVVASDGTAAPDPGSTIDPATAAILDRALTTGDLTTGLVQRGGVSHVVLALAETATGVVSYLDRPIISVPASAQPPDSPYHELNVALYRGAGTDPADLVLTSGGIPSGETVSRPFPIGADRWTLVVSARSSQVGALAKAFPWMVIGASAVFGVLLAMIVEVLIRRRAYAMGLVGERTRSLRAAQLAAEKANQAKSEFLSRMSHELRTPLNAVLGFAQLLELDDLTANQAENVTQIRRGGEHLLDLINEVLDISRIETGNLSLATEPVRVRDVVEDAVALIRPIAENSGIHLLVGPADSCAATILADRQRLKQILLNLLSNAIKYNRQGGTVSITCQESTLGRLRIQVIDTGPGIPADRLDSVFTPFERLGAERTSVPGAGVGLALSRGLAEAMGGRLELEGSTARGSTFCADFPVIDTRAPDDQTTSPGVAAQDRNSIVLYIEDEFDNIQLVEGVLARRPDLTVVPALQGRLGIDLARRHRPVMVLLDLNLVDMSGEEVLRILRGDPATADIPVVIISADAMPAQVERMLAAGADAYLTKPVDIRRLLALVDTALTEANSPAVSAPESGGIPAGAAPAGPSARRTGQHASGPVAESEPEEGSLRTRRPSIPPPATPEQRS